MSESKFRHKNFHQTHALKTRSFIRCNRFAAPVFCFCFVLFLGISLPRRCCCAFARNLPDLGNHPGLHQQTVADPMTNEFTWTQIVNWQSTAILHRIRGERWRQQRLHRKNSQLSISLNKLELRGTWAIGHGRRFLRGRRISLQQACVGHKRFAVIYLFILRFFYDSQLARLHSEEFIFSGWEISSDFGKSIPICKCKLHTYPVDLENRTAILRIASRQLPLLVKSAQKPWCRTLDFVLLNVRETLQKQPEAYPDLSPLAMLFLNSIQSTSIFLHVLYCISKGGWIQRRRESRFQTIVLLVSPPRSSSNYEWEFPSSVCKQLLVMLWLDHQINQTTFSLSCSGFDTTKHKFLSSVFCISKSSSITRMITRYECHLQWTLCCTVWNFFLLRPLNSLLF